MGVLAGTPFISGPTKDVSATLPPFHMAMRELESLSHGISHMPEVCFSEMSDFQHRQCDEFWEKLMLHAGMCLVPIFFLILFLYFSSDQVFAFYRRVGRRAKKTGPDMKGKVTNPSLARGDVFGFFFCLKSIGVAMPDGKQFCVYLPLGEPTPLPGSAVHVYDLGTQFGAKRYVGFHHTPHLAVMTGGRS